MIEILMYFPLITPPTIPFLYSPLFLSFANVSYWPPILTARTCVPTKLRIRFLILLIRLLCIQILLLPWLWIRSWPWQFHSLLKNPSMNALSIFKMFKTSYGLLFINTNWYILKSVDIGLAPKNYEQVFPEYMLAEDFLQAPFFNIQKEKNFCFKNSITGFWIFNPWNFPEFHCWQKNKQKSSWIKRKWTTFFCFRNFWKTK